MSLSETTTPRRLPALRWLLRRVFRLFYRYEAHGQEHLPLAGPMLLAANHQSYFDPILVAIGQDEPVRFMAWSALFSWGWFARIIRVLGAFPVSLDRQDPGAFRRALEVLRAGQRLVIFPEGQRTPDGYLTPLREGVARLALHSGAAIVPVRIEGAFGVWPKPRSWPHFFGHVKVTYGPAVVPPVGRLEPAEREAALRAMMDQLQGFLEQGGLAPPPDRDWSLIEDKTDNPENPENQSD